MTRRELLTAAASVAAAAVASTALSACGLPFGGGSKTPAGRTLVEGFEYAAEWTVDGVNASVSQDTEHVRQGARSLTLMVDDGGYATATRAVSLDLAASAPMSLWLYVRDGAFEHGGAVYNEQPTIDGVTIYVSSDPNFNSYLQSVVNGANLAPGWNCIKYSQQDWQSYGGESWSKHMVSLRIQLTAQKGASTAVSFDSLYRNDRGTPGIAIFFDDGWAAAYEHGYTYMRRHGMTGSIACVPSFVGNTAAGYLSLEQVHELYGAGWDIANHTWDHRDLTTLSHADALADVRKARSWLVREGLSRAADDVVYTDGMFSRSVVAGMRALDVRTARTCVDNEAVLPLATPLYYPAYAVSPRDSLSYVKGYVDAAIERQALRVLIFHKLVETPTEQPTPEWSIADFRALIDYMAARNVPSASITRALR